MKNTRADTIIAHCTPQGSGALALLRLSGDAAGSIAHSFISMPSSTILNAPSHSIHFATCKNTANEVIDQVLVSIMHAPRTFTGENVVEITCHNNSFIIAEVLATAISHGARLAQPGEFAERAFLHKKIDLLQAEAINELITAQTYEALKRSCAQLQGSLSQWITTIEHDLLRALAWSEASFEFLDEEQEFGTQIKEHLEHIKTNVLNVQQSYHIARQIREGIRIALIGTVNAGKSSLFNRLVGSNRAIVTPIAGTTRDVIESTIIKNNLSWTFVDTAGLRTTNDTIEKEGIARSREEAAKADIIILVMDSIRDLSSEEENEYKHLLHLYAQKSCIVFTKLDCHHPKKYAWINEFCAVSNTTGENIDTLINLLHNKVATIYDNSRSPFLLNKRHYHLLQELIVSLDVIMNMLTGTIPYELISYHLRYALERLSTLSGKSITEASLETIFREFCVGK